MRNIKLQSWRHLAAGARTKALWHGEVWNLGLLPLDGAQVSVWDSTVIPRSR